MKNHSFIPLLSTLLLTAMLMVPFHAEDAFAAVDHDERWWPIQSIDTVKFSRDLAREWLMRPDQASVVEEQVRLISAAGATHLAIATPYDVEFRPYLSLWISMARKYGLNVWFRGNFSGWEGWFHYPQLTREEHLLALRRFIVGGEGLFEDGDIFEPCPECENGAAGDPRSTGDIQGHRDFLIREFEVASQAFASIGKSPMLVFSMNGDVARIVMDQKTTEALGGLVAIDHYRQSPQTLAQELDQLAKESGGKIVLGEFGAPVPDIHGQFNESEQAAWLNTALEELSSVEDLIGVNYWVGFGGTTSLWRSDGSSKAASFVLANYFKPGVLRGTMRDELGRPVAGAQLRVGPRGTTTAGDGTFLVLVTQVPASLDIHARGFREKSIPVTDTSPITVSLEKEHPSFFFRALLWFRRTSQNFQTRFGFL